MPIEFEIMTIFFNINVKVENEEKFPKSLRKAQCTLMRQWAGLSRTMDGPTVGIPATPESPICLSLFFFHFCRHVLVCNLESVPSYLSFRFC